MADDPIASNFISDTAQELGPVPQTPNDPKVPFQSSLKLTGEQEKKMIEHAFKRMAGISNELGRDQTLQPTWWANLAPSPNMQSAAQGFLQASTFLGKRSRFDATFMNDVSWRPWTMGVDNIFMSSNIARLPTPMPIMAPLFIIRMAGYMELEMINFLISSVRSMKPANFSMT